MLQSVVVVTILFFALLALLTAQQSVSIQAQVSILPGTDLNSSDLSSPFSSLFGGNDDQDVTVDLETMAAESDPSGIITSVNETTKTYENKEHGFAFEIPSQWNRTADEDYYSEDLVSSLVDPGLILKIKMEPYLSENVTNITHKLLPSLTTMFLIPSFEVKVYRLGGMLDPETLQVRNNTAEEFGRGQASDLEAMGLSPSSSLSNQIIKSEATTIAGKTDAWRIDYIQSAPRLNEQLSFNINGLVVDDKGKLYRLNFSANPMGAPNMIPVFEKILQSFRFTG